MLTSFVRRGHFICVLTTVMRLIKELRNLKIVAKILNIDVPCTAFVDDLDMITLSIPAMQIMVNKVHILVIDGN